MATLKLEIVTPEGRAYSDDVTLVVLPAIEGEIGVYPAHVPLMTQLLPGELRILKDGKTTDDDERHTMLFERGEDLLVIQDILAGHRWLVV